MSRENVEVVRSMLDAWNRGDYSTALETVDPNIQLEAALGGTLDGTYQGHAGLRKWLTDFWGSFDDYRTEIEEYIPAGDHVVWAAHHFGRGRGSGIEVEMQNWHVCEVRDDKIVRYWVFNTKEAALEAVGLRE
jgi:ketosteroid isomerase-like protein